MPPDTPSSSQALLEAVEPTIQSIVRKKLFVTLRRSDFREQNQDALDVLSEIRVKLLQKFAQPVPDENARAIEDFRGYAAAVAFHICADYLRAKHPERTSLKNNLRRLLQKVDGYASWSGQRPPCRVRRLAEPAPPGKAREDRRAEFESVDSLLPNNRQIVLGSTRDRIRSQS
jgi:DNA-directed RNA polymerase specialized sigma24 family protein